jgi:hypothetical protein
MFVALFSIVRATSFFDSSTSEPQLAKFGSSGCTVRPSRLLPERASTFNHYGAFSHDNGI